MAAAITAEGTFTATVDYHDATSSIQAGTGRSTVTAPAAVHQRHIRRRRRCARYDIGFILTNGGQSVTLDISGAETVEDLLNLINGAEIGLLAEINAAATGINVRSRLSGADFTIGENGGTTATQLGIRTYTGDTELAALNRGFGVPTTSSWKTSTQANWTSCESLPVTARRLNVDLAGRHVAAGCGRILSTATGTINRSGRNDGRAGALDCQRQRHRAGRFQHAGNGLACKW